MKRSGQTLLEVLIAATIIVVGMVGLISLLIATQTTARATYQEAVAVQLGREAIEAARWLRDSNWLERESGLTTVSFADGLQAAADPTDYSAIYVWQPDATNPADAITFDFTPTVITDSAAIVYQAADTSYYLQTTATPPDNWTATNFRRLVTFFPICSTDAGLTQTIVTADGQDCASVAADSSQIGVAVQSQISWTDQGTTHSRSLTEQIYDWKYAK